MKNKFEFERVSLSSITGHLLPGGNIINSAVFTWIVHVFSKGRCVCGCVCVCVWGCVWWGLGVLCVCVCVCGVCVCVCVCTCLVCVHTGVQAHRARGRRWTLPGWSVSLCVSL